MSTCPECGTTVTEPDDGMDTTFTCPDCGTTWMDNPRFNERFGL